MEMSMNDQTALATIDYTPVSAESLRQQVNAIQEAMRKVMLPDVHYGIVPGTDKPALLKPGAEKICLMFRLAASLEIKKTDLGGGHREYEVICTLKDASGRQVGQGVGLCSTMESKYRYRGGYTSTGIAVPKDYWKTKDISLIGGKNFAPKKIDGEWIICERGERVEHPDIADTYNTVVKMAKKRAHVDATITTTAASDIFNQDTGEDEPDEPSAAMPTQQPKAASATGYDEAAQAAAGEESQAGSDTVAYEVPYDEKDKWKPLLRNAGHRWNAGAKCWQGGRIIPEMQQFRVHV
jgi:hypothetical protein